MLQAKIVKQGGSVPAAVKTVPVNNVRGRGCRCAVCICPLCWNSALPLPHFMSSLGVQDFDGTAIAVVQEALLLRAFADSRRVIINHGVSVTADQR